MRCFSGLVVVLLAAAPTAAQDMPLSQILLPGEGWHAVKHSFASVRALAADREGKVYVADAAAKRVYRIADGKVSLFAKTEAGVSGLAFDAKGRLCGCEPEQPRIVALASDGPETVLVEGLAARDLVFTRGGRMYCSVPDEHAVYLVEDGKKQRVAGDIKEPTGLALWRGQGTLVVGDAASRYLYAYRIKEDGGLTDREPYYPLFVRPKQASGVAGLTLDDKGRLYAASVEGVQVFDPTGRLCGVLLKPERAPITAVAFGGPDGAHLYVGCGGKVFVRKLNTHGAGTRR